jgi:curved DNA-binding protein CbpA
VVPPPPEAPPREKDDELTIAEAMEILGISPAADRKTIDAAYRERSLQCHPDKVAHLDPDFRALAERKFKRLRAAYEMLSG